MVTKLQLGPVEIDIARLSELCRRYGVKELSAFGSVVRGEAGPGSDLDLLVEFEPGVRIGLIKFESLADDLTALAGRKVDLVRFETVGASSCREGSPNPLCGMTTPF